MGSIQVPRIIKRLPSKNEQPGTRRATQTNASYSLECCVSTPGMKSKWDQKIGIPPVRLQSDRDATSFEDSAMLLPCAFYK